MGTWAGRVDTYVSLIHIKIPQVEWNIVDALT